MKDATWHSCRVRPPTLKTCPRDWKNPGRTAIPIPTDITEPEEVDQSFDRIREELGDPDILVNHAGNAAWGSFADLTPEAFEGAWRVLHTRWIPLFKTGRAGNA